MPGRRSSPVKEADLSVWGLVWLAVLPILILIGLLLFRFFLDVIATWGGEFYSSCF